MLPNNTSNIIRSPQGVAAFCKVDFDLRRVSSQTLCRQLSISHGCQIELVSDARGQAYNKFGQEFRSGRDSIPYGSGSGLIDFVHPGISVWREGGGGTKFPEEGPPDQKFRWTKFPVTDPSNEHAGPSNERVGSSDPRASPSTIPSTPTLSENSDDDSDAVPHLLKLNETLSTHGISPVHNEKHLWYKSYVAQNLRKRW